MGNLYIVKIVYDFSMTRAARAIKIACDNRKQKSYRVNRPLDTSLIEDDTELVGFRKRPSEPLVPTKLPCVLSTNTTESVSDYLFLSFLFFCFCFCFCFCFFRIVLTISRFFLADSSSSWMDPYVLLRCSCNFSMCILILVSNSRSSSSLVTKEKTCFVNPLLLRVEGAGEKGNESPFSLPFLAVSPLKEPLRRREGPVLDSFGSIPHRIRWNRSRVNIA